MTRSRSPRADWWRDYFDEAWFRLHDPLFAESETRAEVAGMIELLGLHQGARVLDAPCGWGRHTVLLAAAGYRVVGADLSVPLLRRAMRGGPACVAADIRQLPFTDHAFDAVLNVFTSLGLFLEAGDELRVLAEARRVLRPGGALLLESMHRDDVVGQYAERDAWTLPDGTAVRVRRRFDAVTGISREWLRWRRGAQAGEKQHALRLRTATEIAALLDAAGFVGVDWYGDWRGARFTHRSAHLIAVARTGRPG
jgi:ubiquinone/menaquinone biosynthesis C-methylase UbiE